MATNESQPTGPTLTRRDFLKTAGAVVAGASATLFLAACGNGPHTESDLPNTAEDVLFQQVERTVEKLFFQNKILAFEKVELHPVNRDSPVEGITVLYVAFHDLLDPNDKRSHIIIGIIQNAKGEDIKGISVAKGPNDKFVITDFYYTDRRGIPKHYKLHQRSEKDPQRVEDKDYIVVHGPGVAPIVGEGYFVGMYLPGKECIDFINKMTGNPPSGETIITR